MESHDSQTTMIDRKGAATDEAFANMTPHERALRAVMDLGLPPSFHAWLVENWPIWDEFVRLADQMRLRGRAYYSARAVLHVLRWHRALQDTTTSDIRINNNQSARMARVYNSMRGVEFFRTREQGGRVPGIGA